MNEIVLNGKRMTTIKITHSYIKQKLSFPEYYGGNLDALWDILSTISQPLHIQLINIDDLYKNLGEYSEDLLIVFTDAADENQKLHFEITNKPENL